VTHSAFETYRTYVLVKAHFTGKYDYYRYVGKSGTISRESFEKRTDKYRFEKLGLEVDHPHHFFASNLVYDLGAWVGDLSPRENAPYDTFRSYRAHFEESLEADLKTLLENQIHSRTTFMRSLRPGANGESPAIATKVRAGQVFVETAAVLNHFVNFVPSWETSKNPVDVTLAKKVSCYSPFVADGVLPDRVRSVIEKITSPETQFRKAG
jgi:hypothetical protein